MGAIGWIFLLLILLIPIAAVLYIIVARYRAKQAGNPVPSFSSYNPFTSRSGAPQNQSTSSGLFGKIRSKFQSSKNPTRSGAYEQSLGGRNRRGLDPDEAWDARVGNEADGYGAGGHYEEYELGLHQQSEGGAYSGGGYGGDSAEEMARGRSLSRDIDRNIGGVQRGPDQRYNIETGSEDPFGDQAERSNLRGVSPRPVGDEEKGHSKDGSGDSPTERRSMFHENM